MFTQGNYTDSQLHDFNAELERRLDRMTYRDPVEVEKEYQDEVARLPDVVVGYEHYITQLKGNGTALLQYVTPCCGALIQTRVGEVGRTWDSLSTCPACATMYMKYTTYKRAWGALLPAPELDELDRKAMRKFAPAPRNFRCYLSECLGTGKNSVLKITGSEFRAAKSGPRKGELVVPIKGTERVCFLP